MHKARENNDGSFSIGKTWMLDDLVSIQSYTDLPATTQLEQQQKQWASNVGFVVTIGKPYYWQAANYKERDFFIASLVKIYKKYTGGRVPKLIGFDERQRQMLIGDTSQGSSQPEASENPQGSQAPQPDQQSSQYSNRAPSREGKRDLRLQPSEEQFLKSQRSRDQIPRPSTGQSPAKIGPQVPNQREEPSSKLNGRLESDRMAGPPKSQLDSKSDFSVRSPVDSSPESTRTRPRGVEDRTTDSRQGGRPPPSRDGKETPEYKPFQGLDVNKEPVPPSTSGSVTSDHTPSGSIGQRTFLTDSSDKLSRPSSRQDGGPPSRGSDRSNQTPRNLDVEIPPSLRPGSSGSVSTKPPSESTRPPPEAQPTKPPPEPTAVPSKTTEPAAAPSKMTEPTTAPSKTTEPTAAPSKTTESTEAPPQSTVSAPPAEPSAEPPATSPPTSPPEKPETQPPEEKEEVHRPGLGPMVKKKSAKDVAGAFRKAANAYSAFKPRPGGAGERLMKQRNQTPSNEPDGITSVVPAPSLRALNNEANKTPASPSTTSQPAPSTTTSSGQEPPKVEITRAGTDDAAQPTTGDETKEALSAGATETTEERSRSRSRSPSQERRRKRREDNTVKYCQALGIDPSLLEGRGAEFDDILTDLGWNGRLSDDKKIEDLEADIRRQIGRVQATSWLGNIEHQEGKIDQLTRLIDKTIEECDELDGLLTLYSHELSVSPPQKNKSLFASTNGIEDASRRCRLY